MSFRGRLRGFFGRKRLKARIGKKRNPGLKALERFARERKGVEGYIEPQTATHSTSLLFVDRDGDHLRAPVQDGADAAAFCANLGIPVYEAAVIGYPRRMRNFEKNRRAAASQDLDEDIAALEARLADEDPTVPDE